MSSSHRDGAALRRVRHHDFVVLELLVCRKITADEFEDRWLEHDDDPGLHELYLQIDNLYDDGVQWFPTLRSMSYEARRKILMVCWFLLSDTRYEWPSFPDWYDFALKDRLLRRKAVHQHLDRQWANFRSAGDVRFWPFLKRPSVRRFRGQRGRWQGTASQHGSLHAQLL